MLPAGIFNRSYEQDMAILRTRLQWIMWIAFLVFLFTFPLYASANLIAVLDRIAIISVTVFGLYILVGLCGQISLGHAAFMGVGAFTTSILAARYGLPFWLTIPCAGLMTGLVGLVFGLPSVRVKGFYLAMTTLAAQFIIIWALRNPLARLTGGPDGMLLPFASIAGIELDDVKSVFYLLMPIALIMGLLAKNIARTRPGRAFIAIRDNDLAAEVMGVNLSYYKLLAFFIGCFYAGVAGALWAYYLAKVDPFMFPISNSIWYLGMLIVGGIGSALGAVLGTAGLVVLEQLAVALAPVIGNVFPAMAGGLFAGLMKVFFGVVIVLFLILEPRGLSHRWELFKASYRLHPFAH